MPEKDIDLTESPPFRQYLAKILQDLAVVEGIQDDIHVLGRMYKLIQITCPIHVLTGKLCENCRGFMQEKVIQLRLDRRDEVVS